MAYSSIPTFVTGQIWTAGNHNQYIRDNFAATLPDIFRAKGDILLSTGSGAGSAFSVGSNDQFLISASYKNEGLSWLGMPKTILKKSSNQTYTDKGETDITWQTQVVDDENLWSSGASISLPKGVWLVGLTATMMENQDEIDDSGISLYLNSDPVAWDGQQQTGREAQYCYVSFVRVLHTESAKTLKATIFSYQSANRTMYANYTYMFIIRFGY